jgi:Putative sensor
MTNLTIASHDADSYRLASPVERRQGHVARAGHAAGRDLAYLTAVLVSSIVGFVAWTVGLSVTLSVAVLVFGVLLWVPAAECLRLIAAGDRRLVGWYTGRPLAGDYRLSSPDSVIERVRLALTDRRVWADVGWLALNSVFGFVVATVALTVTAEVVSLIVMPLWWWALSDPHHQYATLNLGIYTVTSTGWALLTTAIGLALAPVALVINRVAARAHSGAAVRLLENRRAR